MNNFDTHNNNPSGIARCKAQILDETTSTDEFVLPEEVALSISYNGINHAVMLVTPTDIEDFVTGFSLTSGIIEHRRQLYGMSIEKHDEHINAEVEISNQAFWALKSRRRHLAGASGCGLCGIEALEAALPALTPLKPADIPSAIRLQDLRETMNHAQSLGKQSGAVHAALYIDTHQNILSCREDIGRHNAFDKLIGDITNKQLHGSENLVVLSSRCSLELVQKAVRAQLPVLVTLSAPTAMAVRWAARYGLTLIHVPRRDAPRVYKGEVVAGT